MHEQTDRQPVATALTPVTMDSSARIAAQLREQARTDNGRAILAERGPRPSDRAAGPAASAVGLGRPVSVVVVCEGVAEAFLSPSPRPSQLSDDPPGDNETRDLLLSEILKLLHGRTPSSLHHKPQRSLDALTSAETRVLRYLPTNLTATEIADELYVSVHTVKSHMRHIYTKLGAHRRREAVEQARTLGLLAAPSTVRRHVGDEVQVRIKEKGE